MSFVLAGVLFVGLGCKKVATPTEEVQDGPRNQREILKGVGNTLPSVGRILSITDLKAFADLYIAHSLANGKPPANLEELTDVPKPVVDAIKDGSYVVNWNVGGHGEPSTAAIAYEKTAPEKGGVVATLGGSVTKMTPDEAQDAIKAAKRR
jgi:hypothetical protein